MRILLASIYPFIYMLLFLAIPFDNYVRALPNILMGILAITFPFIVTKDHIRKLKLVPTLFFIGFCLALVFNSVFYNRVEADFVVINKVLLAFALVILYIPILDSKKIRRGIVLSSLAIILFSVINIFVIINTSEDIVLGYSRQMIEALLIDRIYIGLISILSVLISYNRLRKEYHPNNKYHLGIIIINILFVFLMVSKITVLVLVLILLLKQLYGKNKTMRFIGLSLAAVVTFAVIQWMTSNVELPATGDSKELAVKDTNHKSFLEQTLTWELRTTIWKCVHHISNDNGLLIGGFGYEGTKEKLAGCYEKEVEPNWRKEQFASNRYNTHNQFADVYFNFGIIAILLFFGFLIATFFTNRKLFMPTAFLAVLVCYCMVEDVFHRQVGAYYVGFILIAVLLRNDLIENKSKKEV